MKKKTMKTVPAQNSYPIAPQQRKQLWPAETHRILQTMKEVAPLGIYATGIENSDPMVNGVRRNQLRQAHDFYEHWEERLENIAALGITWLRFGEGYSHVHLGPQDYNFDLTNKVLQKCKSLGITVIADLLHFGLPDWMHAKNPDQPYFQNPDFPYHFAEYAEMFARLYPHIQYYTPVNEPFITASFSALRAVWNEKRADDHSFVRAAANVAKASILAREAIEKVWKEEHRTEELIYFQNDSFDRGIPVAGFNDEAYITMYNTRRFVAMDLIFGNNNAQTKKYLLAHNISEEEYNWFMQHGTAKRNVLGIDHYPGCIQQLVSRTETIFCEPSSTFMMADVAGEYVEHYNYMPVYHMEVNWEGQFSEVILEHTYAALLELRKQGYPVIPGITWFGDNNFVGWDTWLVGEKLIYPGLFNENVKQPIADIFVSYATKGFPEEDMS